MAFPSAFAESNAVLDRPPGMTDEQCGPLNVCRAVDPDGVPIVVSCWKFSREELDEVNRTGRVWLLIWGRTMPPAAIAGCNPIISAEPT